jgi:hypothetical protein
MMAYCSKLTSVALKSRAQERPARAAYHSHVHQPVDELLLEADQYRSEKTSAGTTCPSSQDPKTTWRQKAAQTRQRVALDHLRVLE